MEEESRICPSTECNWVVDKPMTIKVNVEWGDEEIRRNMKFFLTGKEVKNLNSAAKVSWAPLTHNFLFTCDESTSGQYRTDNEKFSLTMLQCPTWSIVVYESDGQHFPSLTECSPLFLSICLTSPWQDFRNINGAEIECIHHNRFLYTTMPKGSSFLKKEK